MLARIMRALEAVNKSMSAMAADIRELKETKKGTGESLPSFPVQTTDELEAQNNSEQQKLNNPGQRIHWIPKFGRKRLRLL